MSQCVFFVYVIECVCKDERRDECGEESVERNKKRPDKNR